MRSTADQQNTDKTGFILQRNEGGKKRKCNSINEKKKKWSGNSIKDERAKMISELLKINNTLTTLRLRSGYYKNE